MADLAQKLGAKKRVKYNSSSKMQIIIIQTSSKYPATSGTDGKIETKTPEKLLPQGKISMVSCFFPLINFQKNNTKPDKMLYSHNYSCQIKRCRQSNVAMENHPSIY